MPDQPDHFLIDIAVVLKAPDYAAAQRLSEELRELLREEDSVRLVNVCHIDPTSSPEQQLAYYEALTAPFSVKVQEDGGKDWPPTIIDRDTGDEHHDPVIKICRSELTKPYTEFEPVEKPVGPDKTVTRSLNLAHQ